MLVRLQLVATMHGKPSPLVHRMICRTCESERRSATQDFVRRAYYNTKMQKSASHHCRYVNPASRETKPATHQPASQKIQPAASESREPIRFTTSYVELHVKLFHILRKRQPLSRQYATPLHQMLHHSISAKTFHLLLNTSK